MLVIVCMMLPNSGQRWLANEPVSDPGPQALCRWNLLSATGFELCFLVSVPALHACMLACLPIKNDFFARRARTYALAGASAMISVTYHATLTVLVADMPKLPLLRLPSMTHSLSSQPLMIHALMDIAAHSLGQPCPNHQGSDTFCCLGVQKT